MLNSIFKSASNLSGSNMPDTIYYNLQRASRTHRQLIPISKNYSALSNKQLNLKTAINRLTTSHWFVVVQL